MPTAREITTFFDDAPPPGQSPWVVQPVVRPISVVDYDPTWPTRYAERESTIRGCLGPRALQMLHVGSTAVPGLPAKPIIDISLVVADPTAEDAWLPHLTELGYILTVREPWWFEHRCLSAADRSAYVHVFGPDSPEPWKQRIFRDHLRRSVADRALYARTKLDAAAMSTERGEVMMEYNRRKEAVIREIYARAFQDAGFTPDA